MHDVVDELRLISDELARVDPPTASQLDDLSERVYRLAEIIAIRTSLDAAACRSTARRQRQGR